MLGKERRAQEKLFYYSFNLEQRVRADHPLRRVMEVVDFSFVREAVKSRYGRNGRQSEDPVLILKLMFLLFFDNHKSERELLRILPERLDYLWFVGIGLEDPIPHHSILSKARRRWGMKVFQDFFVRVVGQCVAAGLVSGEKVHVDSSLINAHVSMESVIKGPEELIEALKQVYRVQEEKLETVDGERNYYKKKNRELMSRTDPDAVVVKNSRKDQSRPRYKNHRVVDDQVGVITALETTAGDVEDNRKLKSLLRQHERNTGETVQTVVGDHQYGTQENLSYCGRQGIECHLGDWMSKRAESEVWGPEKFEYDAEQDCYWCPAGQPLKRKRHEKARKKFTYSSPAKVCDSCPLKSQCTRSRTGRTLYRYRDQVAIDRARKQSHSPAAKRDRRRRMHLVEGIFADAANNHHFKQARWRRLHKQRIQDYLVGACQNLRKILKHAGLAPGQSVALAKANPFLLLESFCRPLYRLWNTMSEAFAPA